jgi:hypothetical protein
VTEHDKGFVLIPTEVPQRIRGSKYTEAVESFVSSNEPSGKINLGDTAIETAYQGFHKVLKKSAYPVELTRVNGSLYIKRV